MTTDSTEEPRTGAGTGPDPAASFNDLAIEQFRAGEQRIAGLFDRASLLLLHTRGARTGQPRVHPVAYFSDGDRYLVAASAAGHPQHPAWYHNLLADPLVTAEVWTDGVLETFEAIAEPAEGADRDALWAQITSHAPGLTGYQRETERVIPVVTLRRA
jgi:deazaflavin-dependent oxidoreductase (nitroreductase family)